MMCKRCKLNYIKEQLVETPETIHYGKNVCPGCKAFVSWAKNPNNEGKRTRTSTVNLNSVRLFHKQKEPRCFFCLRIKDELGAHETLTLDHIEELDKGGEDRVENLQILCTACHKLKNWARLYMNWHFKEKKA
jgi:5-methylcytosine-specific restriction endonuclease McrA